MTIRGTVGILGVVFALFVCSGCVQPDKTMVQVLVNASMNSTGTLVPHVIPSPTPVTRTSIIPVPLTHHTTNGPVLRGTPPILPADDREHGGFVRYTGADYSLDYPAAWSTNSTHFPPQGVPPFAVRLLGHIRQ